MLYNDLRYLKEISVTNYHYTFFSAKFNYTCHLRNYKHRLTNFELTDI